MDSSTRFSLLLLLQYLRLWPSITVPTCQIQLVKLQKLLFKVHISRAARTRLRGKERQLARFSLRGFSTLGSEQLAPPPLPRYIRRSPAFCTSSTPFSPNTLNYKTNSALHKKR
jgi:hypothetical protein